MPIYSTFLAVCILVDPKPKMPMLFSDGIYFSAWWYLSKILLKFMGASIDFSTFIFLSPFASHFMPLYLFDLIRHKKRGIHSYNFFFFGKIFRQQQRRRKIFFFSVNIFVKRKHFCAQFGRFFIGLLRWWLLKFFCEFETTIGDWEISSTFELWNWKIIVRRIFCILQLDSILINWNTDGCFCRWM